MGRSEDHQAKSSQRWQQFSTFYVADRLYGIEVTKVQEIVKPMAMTEVPLAPGHITGLINLRGQVATAIGVSQLFGEQSSGLSQQDSQLNLMNVVCNMDNQLISLQVDKIGDVVEVEEQSYEPTPQTVPDGTKRFLDGVYKTGEQLISILNIDKIAKFLNQAA